MAYKTVRAIVAGAVSFSLVIASGMPVLAAPSDQTTVATVAAIAYLADNQGADGSIKGFGGETEWAAIALAAQGYSASTFNSSGGTSLLQFLTADAPTTSTPVTTVERKIMAIAASGENSQAFGVTDYLALLAAAHTGGQVGDPTLLNDDIFAVIASDAVGGTELTSLAQDALSYVLAHQAADGGFSYTTASCDFCGSDSNDTAAAIIAMEAAAHLGISQPGLEVARGKAFDYLLTTQQADGGFGYDAVSPSDGSSTAWVLMAFNALGDIAGTPATAARAWLLANQNPDGGFSFGAYGLTVSDTYTTSHAVVALLGTTWLLRPQPQQKTEDPVLPANTSESTPAVSAAQNNQTTVAKSPRHQTVAAPAGTPTEGAVLGSQTSPAADRQNQPSPAANQAAVLADTPAAGRLTTFSIVTGIIALVFVGAGVTVALRTKQ